MCIRAAAISDLNTVLTVTQQTIRSIYPHYYPYGAVEFFLAHHSIKNVASDIEAGRVFLCYAPDKTVVGTVTVRENELCRLFVLPQYQGYGYGRELLDFAEAEIAKKYDTIILDASLPAKSIYLKRGYHVTESHIVNAMQGDFLCYDVLQKQITDKTSVKRL